VQSVLIGTQKGGVGKTSLVASLASLAARPQDGRRVLVIDGDQQANLSRRNFGVDGDSGRGLYSTIVLGEPLKPLHDVRPGLDVVPGGPALAMVAGASANAAAAGLDLGHNLDQALRTAAETGRYQLCLVDLGPGDVALLDAVLAAVQFVVAPHREDDADLDGVELLIRRVRRAQRDTNAGLRLLGTVHFGRDSRATARNAALRNSLEEMLVGSPVTPFEATIRHSPAVARDARAASLTPVELIEHAEAATTDRIAMLRNRKHGRHAAPTPDRRMWGRPDAAELLARDYLAVLKELIRRMDAAQIAEVHV